ncbi:MAG: hypothetical protein ACOCXG_04595 [Nanoarchaeota archaeon]
MCIEKIITNPEKCIIECYACARDLVGLERYDGSKWECRCEEGYVYECFCPICGGTFSGSSFLASQIKILPDLWIANMITHYRHDHRSWDKQWRYISWNCKPETYDIEKKKVNNQIKRALLKNKEFFKFAINNGVTKDSFLRLQDNEEKTIELINKKFN